MIVVTYGYETKFLLQTYSQKLNDVREMQLAEID